MAKRQEPWFRKQRNTWCVYINGKLTTLCEAPNRRTNKQKANDILNKLLAEGSQEKNSAGSFGDLCDEFLEWSLNNQPEATYEWHRCRLVAFCKMYPNLTIDDLRPHHVTKFADKNPKHSATTKRNNIQAVKRVMRWAMEQGYIDSNPIAFLKKPKPSGRKREVPIDEFNTLLSFVKNDNFKDLLLVTYYSGARPQEIFAVEAKNIDLEFSRWIFKQEIPKGEIPRQVFLDDIPLEITLRLMAKHPTGKLFRNKNGKPWTKDAVGCAFDLLQKRMAVSRMKELGLEVKGRITTKVAKKYAKRHCLYEMRHSWANNAGLRGIDGLTIGLLGGHKDPSTYAKTYQHLGHNPEYLLTMAKLASSGKQKNGTTDNGNPVKPK